MYYAVKPLYVINPNTIVVENQYTHEVETMIIAGTQLGNSYYLNDQGRQFTASKIYRYEKYIAARSYGKDKYGRVIGDIDEPTRYQWLSYDLIVNGYCYWYKGFDPNDVLAKRCEAYAKLKHIGVWK
jgi:hypothetical protein